ncbi:MAG TPA: PAS domain S-box protein [Solirubrobacteraceae bacterium]|nr:PAS domain S-box protein [Solirubrobacteraceae bacterium]
MSDPLRDALRLDALRRSELMDSKPEEVFDRLTRLATKLLGTPVATMTLVDDTRQYFKSSVGTTVNQTPLSHSFCQHVVTGGVPLVVTDARQDPRVKDNAAIEDLDVIAYCGVPLTDADGHTLGSFCAIEHGPRQWTEIEIEILTELAHNIMTELDLRAANRALIARERETRLIIENAHDAFIAIDADQLIVDWNPSAERLFGWSAGDAIGRYVSETILPDLATGYDLERHASVAADLPALPVEVTARHHDGRELQVEVSIARVDTPAGRRCNALIRDIAERRASQLQREQLARVVESTNDAVITVDLTGTITSWNGGAERLYGFGAEEMIGTAQSQAAEATGTTHPGAGGLMLRLIAGEHVTERAVARRHRNGSRLYVDLSAAPLRDPDGTVIGATSIARDVTDQHRLEVNLEQSEARFRETFDEAPIGVALVGPNGRWLEVNRALCEIVGYSEAELLERTFQDISHPDDLEADLAKLGQVLTGEIQTYQMEKRYFHKDGHSIWAKLSVALVRDERGTPLHFVSHIENITRAKAAESALREGRRLLDESQSVAGVGSWTWNLETGDPAWSVQQYLLHGVNPLSAAPAMDDFLALVHPEDRERVRTKIFDIVRHRQPFVDEYRVALGSGRVRTLSVRGDYLAADPSVGLPPRIAGTAQDITAERAARIGREQIEYRQRVLLSSLPDTMVVLYDRELRCRFVQGALMTELGVDRDAFEGKLLSELVPTTRLETLEPAIQRAFTGESGSLEYSAGDGRAYAVDIAPYHSEDRTITGAFSVWRDISQRRRLDDELRASREKALEASRLKSEFVANMSHEIRTPLNGVVSMAELLLDTPLNGEQSQYAQVAMTSAEALMRVINDILDFSKIEAGKLEIAREDFSVLAAVDDVAEIVGVRAAERGLALEVSVDPDVAPVIIGDGNRVRQVLLNLLSNAVKFTSEGEVTVTVALADIDDDQLRFEVADTGIGIDAEKLAALFEPFSQADATTTRRYGGTGLGLCISKQLVELMGGEIGCASEPGVGSRFWFTLPYEPGLGLEADLHGHDLTGARVLVVDGDADTRASLQTTLASWGIRPETAGEGGAALDVLRTAAEAGRPFETALIAAQLPDSDGPALAREIGDVPALRATRLIMTVSSPAEAAAADAAGVQAQVAKPIRPSRLYNQLLATLHRTGTGQTAIVAPAPAPGPAPVPAASVVSGDGCHVLVVEDNEINQFAAIRLLRSFGLVVDVAANGREAIMMTGSTEYSAVFMDCQMPDVDGYTATRVIRRREEQTGRHTPIIALTAHALDGDREKCLSVGMDDYLSKPLRRDAIQNVLGRLAEFRPADRSGDSAGAATSDVFDPAPLQEIGDPETEVVLATMFLDQSADRLPAMREAIAAHDAQRLHGLAHGLKGSAATVGATRMSEIAKELCEIAAAGQTAGALDLHDELADALAQTRAVLSGHISRW